MKRSFWFMRFLPTAWVVYAATLGPIGLIKKAPGTWGSLAGLLFYAVVYHFQPIPLYVITTGLLVYIGTAVCDEAEIRLQQRDPGKVVIDEFAAMPICFLFLQPAIDAMGGWPLLLAGFLLFRLFDIWKPWPIEPLQKIPGGLGVMLDDIAAAAVTCGILHLGVILTGMV